MRRRRWDELGAFELRRADVVAPGDCVWLAGEASVLEVETVDHTGADVVVVQGYDVPRFPDPDTVGRWRFKWLKTAEIHIWRPAETGRPFPPSPSPSSWLERIQLPTEEGGPA